MTLRYYCFPDIHGRYDLLKKALDFVYKANPAGGKIIFLGDYIDRGKENKKVLDTVMFPPENWEFICLKGNHEDMFIDAYVNRKSFYDFAVLEELSGPGKKYNDLVKNLDVKYVDWMKNLKLFHFEDKNIFAHAFYDTTLSPEQQEPEIVMWQRMDDWQSFPSHMNSLFLTHGHTPRKNGPILSPMRLNLDCGACYYDRFVIAEYEKDVTGHVALHEFERWK